VLHEVGFLPLVSCSWSWLLVHVIFNYHWRLDSGHIVKFGVIIVLIAPLLHSLEFSRVKLWPGLIACRGGFRLSLVWAVSRSFGSSVRPLNC
jgi:hypothetical protein